MPRVLLPQGVSHAFSKAYHHVCTLENIMQVALAALGWLHPRSPTIRVVTTYLMEPGRDKVSPVPSDQPSQGHYCDKEGFD